MSNTFLLHLYYGVQRTTDYIDLDFMLNLQKTSRNLYKQISYRNNIRVMIYYRNILLLCNIFVLLI